MCQGAKPANRAPAGTVTSIAAPHSLPKEPGTHWALEFIELPLSTRGLKQMLVCTERLSKSVILGALQDRRDASSLAVTRVLVNEVFKWFGMPTSILSDCGLQFHSAVFHEVCQMLGTSVRHNTPHTPHSHGDVTVERQIRLVNDILRTLQQRFPDIMTALEAYLGFIQYFMNSYIVECHHDGMTPTFFWHGRQPRIRSPASISLQFGRFGPRTHLH